MQLIQYLTICAPIKTGLRLKRKYSIFFRSFNVSGELYGLMSVFILFLRFTKLHSYRRADTAKDYGYLEIFRLCRSKIIINCSVCNFDSENQSLNWESRTETNLIRQTKAFHFQLRCLARKRWLNCFFFFQKRGKIWHFENEPLCGALRMNAFHDIPLCTQCVMCLYWILWEIDLKFDSLSHSQMSNFECFKVILEFLFYCLQTLVIRTSRLDAQEMVAVFRFSTCAMVPQVKHFFYYFWNSILSEFLMIFTS